MDDPFGCLQGEKISTEKTQEIIKEMLQKRNELRYPLPKKIVYCPSCEERMNVKNGFCRGCPKCCRVFEYDDEQQEENQFYVIIPPAMKPHLKTVLQKCDIFEMLSSFLFGFLSKIIARFKMETGAKTVNYTCFLYNYFEIVPSETWPKKSSLLNLFLSIFLKI